MFVSFNVNAQCKEYIIGVNGDTLNCVDMNNKKQGRWVIKVDNLRGERGYEEVYNVYGGLQDNGVWYTPSKTTRSRFTGSGLGVNDDPAKFLGGGDGMQVQVDRRNNLTAYYGSQFGNYSRTNRVTREGRKAITPRHELGEFPYRFNWQSPILLSSHNPDIVYFGSNHFLFDERLCHEWELALANLYSTS